MLETVVNQKVETILPKRHYTFWDLVWAIF
jgi:hypothetical protein